MKILGIETSCDDTGIAVLEVTENEKNPEFRILSNIVASQIDVHQEYGGVFPSLAKREHQKNLPITLQQALKEAGIEKADAVAVTYGPGLSPCLWTGLNFAKDLAQKWNVPLIPVDHIEGHLLIGLLKLTNENSEFPILNFETEDAFPAIGLIVSGGHTQLVLVKDIGEYEIIGETRDDAAGEAFDKTARLLGLAYPGGPAVAAAAALAGKPAIGIKLPRPMVHSKDYDFSFSGLKTAVLYDFQSRAPEVQQSKEYVQAMAHEIQQAIVDILVSKTTRAVKEYAAASVILGGGVAANDELRRVFEATLQTLQILLLAPPKNLSTDNGAMIAVAGYFQFQKGNILKEKGEFENLEAQPNLRIA